MNLLEAKIHAAMIKAGRGELPLPADIKEEFLADAAAYVDRQFNSPRREYRLSMSNIGRPLCQQMAARDGWDEDARPVEFHPNMLTGDAVEAHLKLYLRLAGVEYEANKKVKLRLNETLEVPGELDLIIKLDGKVYDVKSCSRWAWTHKFASFESLESGDDFGYVGQLVGYAEAEGLKPGGWLVLCKENGKFKVLEFPEDQGIYEKHLQRISYNAHKIASGAEFQRYVSDEEETHRKVKTGNRKLGKTCEFCGFKQRCWTNLQYRPKIPGDAKYRDNIWYTYVAPEYDETEQRKG